MNRPMNIPMTEKIKRLEDIITVVLEDQKNRDLPHWNVFLTAEEGEIILAALSVYRKKWEESREKESKI